MFEAEPARPGQNIAVSGRIREKRRQRHAAENKSIEPRIKEKKLQRDNNIIEENTEIILLNYVTYP